MMSEPISDGAGQGAREYALRYVAAGFSVLPVADNKRPYAEVLPLGDDGERHWQQWTTRQPTPEEIDYWFRKAPDAGVGIILGQVSGNAVALDVDDGLFSNWVQTNSPVPHSGAWCNLTGSGKVHVIVRTAGDTSGGVLNDGRDGRKLADIRGDGQYVVAPPSLYARTGGSYRVWSGAPEQVPLVRDAQALWGLLRDSYARGPLHTPNGRVVPNGVSVAAKHPQTALPPLQGAARAALEDRVRGLQSARARKALTEGVQLGEAPWNASDWSSLDYMLCKDLMRCGWTDDEIHGAYATLPIGEHTYRNLKRPDHGMRYLLDFTLPNARKDLADERERAKAARGQNFELQRAVCLHYEPPIYHLTFERTDVQPHTVGTVVLTVDELFQERLFKRACFRDLGWLVELQGGHKGQGFDQLIKAIASVVEDVWPPRSATEEGHIAEMVRQALKDRLDRHAAPEQPSDIRFGWIEPERGNIFVSGHALMAHFRQSQRHPPTPQKVWGVLEKMGARSRRLRIGQHQEEFWVLDLSVLD